MSSFLESINLFTLIASFHLINILVWQLVFFFLYKKIIILQQTKAFYSAEARLFLSLSLKQIATKIKDIHIYTWCCVFGSIYSRAAKNKQKQSIKSTTSQNLFTKKKFSCSGKKNFHSTKKIFFCHTKLQQIISYCIPPQIHLLTCLTHHDNAFIYTCSNWFFLYLADFR